MSILGIVGLPGSGKSHQAMIILVENYANGRNIKTNLKGLKLDKIKEYCIKKFPKCNPDEFGTIEIFEDYSIEKTNFFPTLTSEDNKEVIHDKDSIIKSGDVVIIDEAGKCYGDPLKKEALDYFIMHRHFTDKNNLESEILLMVQDISLITAKLKKLIKNTYLCRKLDGVGFAGYYYLGIFTGGTIRASNRINDMKKAYDKDIFELYESQSGGKGKESKLDSRANVFKNPKMIALIIAIIIAPILLVYTLWSFFHPANKKVESLSGSPSSSISSSLPPSASAASPVSSEPMFKIVGVLDTSTKRLIFLQDQFNSIKLVYPQSCTGSGMLLVCKIDNKEISYYSSYKPTGNNKNENKNNSPSALPNTNNK